MRWFMTLMAVVLVSTIHAAENEAEKVFREAEKNLQAAKTVLVRFDVKATTGKLQGTLVLAEQDKMRVDCKGSAGPLSFQAPARIGNGTTIITVSRADTEKASVEKTADSPKGLGSSLRGMLLRSGILMEFIPITGGKTPAETGTTFKLSNFKFGANEKVGDIDARVIEYTVAIEGKSVVVWMGALEKTISLKGMEKASAKLWVDSKTNLPMKLEVRSELDGAPVEFVETFVIDGKVDAKLFEGPK